MARMCKFFFKGRIKDPRGSVEMTVFVAVDTGGTFTDLVSFDAGNGEVRYTKSLTTHHDPIDGIVNCFGKAQVALSDATLFKHGTTLVINTLLERAGPTVALVTTRGFRDVLEFARGNRTALFDLFYRRDPVLVPRELRFEIDERVAGSGEILQAPRRAQVQELANVLRERDVAAVAISFINSYLEPANERLVAEWLREMLPGCYITAGTELTREWYEYERTATAAANAYSGPKIGGYVAALDNVLGERGFKGQFLLMGSSGGVLSAQHAASAPVLLVESGPVGGCIGAGVYGQALGLRNIIAFDMGGTTAKCALVRDGEFNVESLYHVGGYGRGTPVRAPVIDIVEVGTGGGSIAWFDEQRRIHVGPKSAGSSPGPVCYGKGGTEPTVTDANLVLGRLNAQRFQGGEMALDTASAEKAITERLAYPLGYVGELGGVEVASGIISIALVQMSEAIKRVTVQRGEDPRDYVLFAYGGGGPLHSVELARELAIPLVVIPPEAGNFSAIGMLVANIRRDTSRTFVQRLDAESLERVDAEFGELEQSLRDSIAQDFGDVPIEFERAAQMRYLGQQHTVKVSIRSLDPVGLRQTFVDTYEARYGHAIAAAEAEIVSLHSTAQVQTARPNLAKLAGEAALDAPPEPTTRPIFFAEKNAFVSAKVFSRERLPIGFSSQGPCVIEEYGSTTVLGPADRFEIGVLGEIRITVGLLNSGVTQ